MFASRADGNKFFSQEDRKCNYNMYLNTYEYLSLSINAKNNGLIHLALLSVPCGSDLPNIVRSSVILKVYPRHENEKNGK